MKEVAPPHCWRFRATPRLRWRRGRSARGRGRSSSPRCRRRTRRLHGPVPGSMPKKAPMAVPRKIAPNDAFMSSQVGNKCVTLALKMRRSCGLLRLAMISPIANMPTASTMKSMPSVSSGKPNAMRDSPVLTSVPTLPSSSPSATMASEFSMSPCASTAAATRPISISEKYSGAANCSAMSAARRTARSTRADRAGEERADGGDGKRRPGPPLPRHLIAVEQCQRRRFRPGD